MYASCHTALLDASRVARLSARCLPLPCARPSPAARLPSLAGWLGISLCGRHHIREQRTAILAIIILRPLIQSDTEHRIPCPVWVSLKIR